MSNFDFIGGQRGPYGVQGPEANGYITKFIEDAASSLLSGPADDWYANWSYTPPDAALETVVAYNAAGLAMEPWKGVPAREPTAPKFARFSINIYQKGALFDYFRLATGEPVAWTLQPDAISLAMSKKLGIELGTLWGTAIGAGGVNVLDVWGSPWLRTDTGVPANNNPNNPFRPDFGTYYNLTYNSPLTAANVRAADIRLRSRRGQDGRLLGLKPRYLIVNFERGKEAEEIAKTLRIVPVPTGNATTTFVSGDSATVGLYEIIESLEMPRNMWVLSADPALLPEKMRPFVTIRGLRNPSQRVGAGSNMLGQQPSAMGTGSAVPNIDGMMMGGLPEFWFEFWGTNSRLFEDTKKIAVDGWVFNGIFPQDGRLFDVNVEGAAP